MSAEDTALETAEDAERLESRRLALATRFHSDLIAYHAVMNASLVAKGLTVVQMQPEWVAGTAVDHADALLLALSAERDAETP